MKQTILILTASIGSGHIKAAEAVAEQLNLLLPQANIVTIDFMAKKTSVVHWFMKEFYLQMLAFVPNLYDVFYKLAGEKSGGSVIKGAFALVMQPVISRLLKQYQPDVVFCTHPFPEAATSLWKERHHSNLPLAVVMTDYSLHEIWLRDNVDLYFMATKAMKQQMLDKGYDEKMLFACGIPICMDVEHLPARDEIRKEYEVPEKQPAILLMGGGLGLGGINQMLQELEGIAEKMTLFVVTGKNEHLQSEAQAFARTSHHHVLVWGYTDKVHELMQASDLLLTKPGALTISEAFAVGLPMLLHDPIPGPETENAVYATRHGAAIWLHPGEKLAPAVLEILSSGSLAQFKQQAKMCARPQAAREIAGQLAKLMQA